MGKVIGIGLRYDQFLRRRHGRRRGSRHPQPRRRAHDPLPVVAFQKDGSRIVGPGWPKRQAVANPDRTVISIKRHNGAAIIRWTIDGKKYSPQEISAMILSKLKADAESYLGGKVTDARHHLPRQLYRQPAPGDEGRRQDRWG